MVYRGLMVNNIYSSQLAERERERERERGLALNWSIREFAQLKVFISLYCIPEKYKENFDFSSRNSVYIPPSLEFPRNSLPDTPLKCRSQVVSALKG